MDTTTGAEKDPLYYLYDGLGSVVQLTDSTGKTADQYAFDEFGNQVAGGKQSPNAANVLHNTFGYAGEQWDSEAGLQYLRARYYDPEKGRFINRDSFIGEMGNPLSQNRYAYAWNNPVNLTDPSGNKPAGMSYEAYIANLRQQIAVQERMSYNPSTTTCNQTVEGSQEDRINKRYEQWVREYGNIDVNGFYEGSGEVEEKPKRVIMPGVTQLIFDHYYYREELNNGVPNSLNEAKSKGWILMSREESVFHQIGTGKSSNVKYMSPDGHNEAVYNSLTGNLDTSPLNRGTYNFIAPKGVLGKLGHGIVDVLPYYLLGNTPNDMTDFGSRIDATIEYFKIKLGIN